MTRRCRALLAAALLSTLTASLRAADLLNVLSDYSIASWGLKNGLPTSAVWAIAQDSEGYLWLGADSGLIRFDGLNFVPWRRPGMLEGGVRAICATRDGSLWVGFGEPGGVNRLQNGQVVKYAEGDVGAHGAVTAIVEDDSGRVWIAGRFGLRTFAGGRWRRWDPDDGLPDEPVYSAIANRDGGVIVGTATGVFALSENDDRFIQAASVSEFVRSLSLDASGRVWVTDSENGFHLINDAKTTAPDALRDGRGSRLLHDSRGNLWVGTRGQGLWRVQFGAGTNVPSIERATSQTGLLGEGLQSLFEDREGNIWAGTLDGLNRLTPHKITPVVNLGLVSGVEAASDGKIWVGALHRLVWFASGDRTSGGTIQLSQQTLSAMHADENGTVWISTGRDLQRIEDQRLRDVSSPAVRRLAGITVIASDRRGGLWLNDREQGLLRWRGGTVEPVSVPALAELRGQVVAIQTDRTLHTWLTLGDGRIAALGPQNELDIHDPKQGLSGGVYRAIYEDHEGTLWFGSNRGLTRYANGRFDTIGSNRGFPANAVTAIVEDEEHQLWLGTDVGILCLDRSEFDRALSDVNHQIHFELYDKYDGSAGTPSWYGNRGATRAVDGRLWFVGSRGVSILNPHSLSGKRTPIQVRVEGLAVSDRFIEARGDVSLPPRPDTISIRYTALNLAAPLRTQFRYRLDGVDAEWVNAGSRREANYANLSPGRYHFRVVANTEQGTWAEPGAAWDFAVQPAFYQTAWFVAAVATTLALTFWVAWQFRLRKVRRQFALLLAERARLSREIHDTLLQGLFGVALRCDAIAGEIASAAPGLKEHFVQMRDDINDYIRDARQSIWNLRPSDSEPRDLDVALRGVGERLTTASGVAFRFDTLGASRSCGRRSKEQLLRIGREAVTNAVRHAHASEIRMDVHYGDDSVLLRVIDDGCGFDPATVDESEGHYGLKGMKERAAEVCGSVVVQSATGRGTQVEVTLPYA